MRFGVFGGGVSTPGQISPLTPTSLGPVWLFCSGDAYNANGVLQTAPSGIYVDGSNNVVSLADPHSHIVCYVSGIQWATASAPGINTRGARRAYLDTDPGASAKIQSPDAPAWSTGVVFTTIGNLRKSGLNRYRNKTTGTTGGTAPTGAVQDFNDGGVIWDYVGAAGDGLDVASTGITGIMAWTIFISLEFTEDGTGGTAAGNNALFILGKPSDLSAIKSGMISTKPTAPKGTIFSYPLANGAAAPEELWGTENLIDGTAGNVVPSKQVVLMRHWLSGADGKWYIDLFIDGMLRTRAQANSGLGWNITQDAFSIGPSGFTAVPTWLGPAYRLFDAAIYPRALTTAEIRSVTRWCLDEVAATDADISAVHIGDSITAGGNATSPTTEGYVARWPIEYAGITGRTPKVHNHGISGWTSLRFQQGDRNGSVENSEFLRAMEYVGVRARARLGVIAFGTNDVVEPDADLNRFGRNVLALTNEMLTAGCNRIIIVLIYPWTHGTPGVNTDRDTWNAYMRTLSLPSGAERMDPCNDTDTRINTCTTPLAATFGALVASLRDTAADWDGASPVHPDTSGHEKLGELFTIQVLNPV